MNSEQMKSICFLIALFSCSCGDSTSEVSLKDSPNALVGELAHVQCQRIFDCCGESELEIIFGTKDIRDRSACEKKLRSQMNIFFAPSLESAQEKKRILLDETQVASCGKEILKQKCNDLTKEFSELIQTNQCLKAVIPQQESSGFCDHDYECKSSFCLTQGDKGTCKTILKEGGTCEHSQCGGTLFCDHENRCRKRLKSGVACKEDNACQSGKCLLNKDEPLCAEEVGICNG